MRNSYTACYVNRVYRSAIRLNNRLCCWLESIRLLVLNSHINSNFINSSVRIRNIYIYMIGARLCAVWNNLTFADSDFWLIVLILWLKIRNSYSSCNIFHGLFFASAILLFHRVNCRSVRSGIGICNYYRHLHNSAGTIWVGDLNRYVSCASLSCSWKRSFLIYKFYCCSLWSRLVLNCRSLYSLRNVSSSRCFLSALLVDSFCTWLVGLVIWIANCYRNFHVIR